MRNPLRLVLIVLTCLGLYQFLDGYRNARLKNDSIQDVADFRQVGLILKCWVESHKNTYPHSLKELIDNGMISDPELIRYINSGRIRYYRPQDIKSIKSIVLESLSIDANKNLIYKTDGTIEQKCKKGRHQFLTKTENVFT